MNETAWQILHQAAFGGAAAMGFGILFNYSPRLLPLSFGAGALTLAVRTMADAAGWGLPTASFAAALTVALLLRLERHAQPSLPAYWLALVACIPLIPGAIAMRSLLRFFELARSWPLAAPELAAGAVADLVIVSLTLVALGAPLALTMLIRANVHDSTGQD
jgi:uncharacterized membrane protein YjjB (DUF3815 family)